MTSTLAAAYERLDFAQKALDDARAFLRQSEEKGDESLIGPADLALRLGLKEKTIYDMVSDGKIPAFKIGGALRFSWTEVKEATRR